jgi:hypothetical protein
MNITFFTWENVYWLSQLLLVAFAGVALISGRIVNNRQAAQSLTLQTELATAKGKQADAERSLLELQKLIGEPRTIDEQRANEILDWGAKGAVDILAVTNDEAHKFATSLANVLWAHGWTIIGVNAVVAAGGIAPGVHVTAPDDTSEPAKTFRELITGAVRGNPAVDVVVDAQLSKQLPEGSIRVVVGQKF